MYYLCYENKGADQLPGLICAFVFNICKKQLLYLFQPHNLLNKIKTSTSEKEQEQLIKISQEDSLHATLLPIKTVGVQVSLQELQHNWCL